MSTGGLLSAKIWKHSPLWHVTDESEGRVLSALDQINRCLPLDELPPDVHFAAGACFNVFVFILIVSNTLMLGIEIDNGVGDSIDERLGFFLFDLFFFLGFLGELIARVHHEGWDYFVQMLNVFDFYIICVTAAELAVAMNGEASGVLKMISAVRVVRLLRVVEKLKAVSLFRNLWTILNGFMDVLKLQFYVVAMLLLVAYTGGVVMTDLVSEASSEYWLRAPNYFGTVFVSMFTILQFGTFDNWVTDIMRPMTQVSTVSTIVMFFLLVVIAFGVTNVMLAVMVEAAMSRVQETVENSEDTMKKMDNILLTKLVKDLKPYESGSGTMTRQDFYLMLTDKMVQYKIRLLGVNVAETVELFDIIDCDGAGRIKTYEFVLGLSKLRGPARGLDFIALIYYCGRQCATAKLALKRLQKLNKKADLITERLNGVGKQMSGELVSRRNHRDRTEEMWSATRRRCTILKKLDEDKKNWYPRTS